MESTKTFKKTIESHLQSIAVNDPLFAKTLAKPNKNIDDCITYILNAVQKSGCNGFADEEIYNMAIHYYDEDNIDIGSPIDTKVVVNHTVELSAEEIEQAKQRALDEVVAETKKKLTEKKAPKKTEEVVQSSLF